MTVTRGKKHIFLRMHITYKVNGTVKILMREYLEEAIVEFSEADNETIKQSATSPAKRNLFTINDKSKLLDKHRSETLHSVSAKLLYVSKRSRLDIQLAIALSVHPRVL